MGPGTDSLTSMPYTGFEPDTFDIAAGSPNHYTSWSAFVDYDKVLDRRPRVSFAYNIAPSSANSFTPSFPVHFLSAFMVLSLVRRHKAYLNVNMLNEIFFFLYLRWLLS